MTFQSFNLDDDDEGYSEDVLCTLRKISTFVLYTTKDIIPIPSSQCCLFLCDSSFCSIVYGVYISHLGSFEFVAFAIMFRTLVITISLVITETNFYIEGTLLLVFENFYTASSNNKIQFYMQRFSPIHVSMETLLTKGQNSLTSY